MGCGLRLNELRQLRLADVHIERPLSESWVLVRWNRTKSKGERRVRLDPKVAAAIHAYIADARAVSKHLELFLTEEGKPFTYNGLQGYSGRIGDRLEAQGIAGWTAHRCRHQWATDGARNGMTEWELAIEGGWRKGSKVPARYVDDARFRFEDLQRKPTALSGLARSA